MANKAADENQRVLHKKFPSTHYLNNPKNVDHIYLWSTFFRRNLHRFVTDYLGIRLHLYQAIMLYFMGISQFIVTIASRSASKSFVISVFAVAECVLRPNSKIVISSATKGQSKLIISEKIKNELMNMSPVLRQEILSVKDSQYEAIINFRNGSTIRVVPALESGRGNRSTMLIREEFRQIVKLVDDAILSPFQVVRNAAFMTLDYYRNMKELREEPVDIYISSSWFDGHWMWDIVDKAAKGMLKGDGSILFAFDESIPLRHGIKTQQQLQNEKSKLDALTWRIEFLNEKVKENNHALFSYNVLSQNQRLKKAFYPLRNIEARNKKSNPHAIPKQDGEVRIVACDMAFVQNKTNDNSIFSCFRLLPENKSYQNVSVDCGYRRQVVYIESCQGGETSKQALRIRQLYEDFEADYIVLDLRNAGISVYDCLAKVMYDEDRDVEYSPLTAMNNDGLTNRVKNAKAKPVIFTITASLKLNSDIAFCMKNTLESQTIDFLVDYKTATEEILPKTHGYRNAMSMSVDEQLFYEKPYLETQALISEMIELTYERKEQTGAIVVSEKGGNRKDRWSSVSYGNYFASLLEQDLVSVNEEYAVRVFVN